MDKGLAWLCTTKVFNIFVYAPNALLPAQYFITINATLAGM